MKPVIGMIHLPALPGAPGHVLSLDAIREFALRDAGALVAGGVHGLLLENFGDTPFYPDLAPPHTVACMTLLAGAVRERFDVPLGINMLRNDGAGALAVAHAAGAQFVRINVYTGARVTDQGIIQGKAHEWQRYRRELGAEVLVFADVAVKHSAPLGARAFEDEVEDTVRRGRADAIIVSGAGTGKPASPERLRAAVSAADPAPVLVGSGARPEDAVALLGIARGLIVGSAFKENGDARNPVDPARVRDFMRALA